eukprot:NODE_594_length_2041_cov_17.438349_g552_i0.p1 GENE.NODE_594_length_2041_cov_17.438349_g552_i0~~NODE_594_length_2041_cov_17.438349_g552_i0.p1  ORF type:complete len:509 (+),score=73.83 NODE_594_length_2041_cov_17.438349_g552_i0:413-1939(+)
MCCMPTHSRGGTTCSGPYRGRLLAPARHGSSRWTLSWAASRLTHTWSPTSCVWRGLVCGCTPIVRPCFSWWTSCFTSVGTHTPTPPPPSSSTTWRCFSFPHYTVSRSSVFPTRAQLLAYQAASVQHTEWSDCYQSHRGPRDALFLTFVQEVVMLRLATHQCYTSEGVFYPYSERSLYVRMLHHSVGKFEAARDYPTAVLALRQLLDSGEEEEAHYGKWWCRLALDLEHLNMKEEALQVCEYAVTHTFLSAPCRLALERRLARLHEPPRRWGKKPRCMDLIAPQVFEVKGVRLGNGNTPDEGRCHLGPKSLWRHPITGASCSVETLVLADLSSKGWVGVHSEGGLLSTVFMLLMWDVVYADVPHVFQTRFQTKPLDWRTKHFWANRRESIEARLTELRSATPESIVEQIENSWAQHSQCMCGVNWEKSSLDSLLSFSYLPPTALAALMRVVCHKQSVSGFPDLHLWHPIDRAVRMVEVKGPGDRLSEKQVVWLHVLLSHGIYASVCNVS